MMVLDETSATMSNQKAPSISSPTESKLDTISSTSSTGSKSLPKRSSSSRTKRSSLGKPVSSASSEQKARVSDSLKKSIAKELKSSKSSKSGSRGLGPLGRSQSTRIPTKDKKDKKKKKKKTLSDTSLRTRSLDKDGSITTAGDDNTSTHNSTFPLHTHSPLARSTSESTGKKKVKRRTSTKKSKLESTTVDELIDNHKSLGISEHTTDTVSTSGSNDDDYSKKTASKKKGKRLESRKSKGEEKSSSHSEEKSSSHSEEKSSVEEDDAVPLTFSPEATSKKKVPPKTRRPMSFESIHGKSIHKPSPRRGSITNVNTDISEIRDKGHEVQPPQVYGTLTASPCTKKKSVLKAKKEKQLLKNKQEHEEEEKKALKSRQGQPSALKKKEDYIHEVLKIVNSNHSPKNEPVVSSSHFEASNPPVDPDECSSQSSSCSIVSDGSYEKDDLLSHTSDHSEERNVSIETPENFRLQQNASFEEDSFTMEVESPSFSEPNASPTKGSYSETMMIREESFKSTLMEAMASSMSALPEVDDEEEESPKPVKSVLKKSVFKRSPIGKPPLRLVPKRSQSDVTSLKSMKNNMSNNFIEVRFPGERKKVVRHRSLKFNEKVRVKRIPCQAQVCGGDTSDLWFQPQEYDAIKRKTMALIRAVQDDQTGGVTYCTRGLERYFSVDDVQEKRNDAWDSVLDEQQLQRDNNEVFNADRLSRLYAATTKPSTEEAIQRGKLDEDAIARYTKKMRQTLRRTYSMPV